MSEMECEHAVELFGRHYLKDDYVNKESCPYCRIALLEKACEEMVIYIKHDSLRPSIPHRRAVEALRAAGYGEGV